MKTGNYTRDEGHLKLGGQWTKLRRDRMPKTKKALPQNAAEATPTPARATPARAGDPGGCDPQMFLKLSF